jgi:hypothetical protein
MQQFIYTFLLCFIVTQVFGQARRKVSMYLQGQFNTTIYDRTAGNNPWGAGLGLQALLHHPSRVKPTVDCTADAYLANDKVLRLNADGTPVDHVGSMVNLFAGASYHPTQRVYLSFVAGPSLISGQMLLGIKPSVGFYFSPSQRWTGKASYINIFNRNKRTNKDFGSVSLSIGVRLL